MGQVMTILHSPRQRPAPAERAHPDTDPADLTIGRLTAFVMSPLAECADSADEWFPVATRPAGARAEGARALALCAVCPVRAECLELSMRIWPEGGQHGIWGGLVEGDRAEARRAWRAGVPVRALLDAGSGSGHLPPPRRP
jgi:WhiB family redox-sensing transcriptional regulator